MRLAPDHRPAPSVLTIRGLASSWLTDGILVNWHYGIFMV
jgi:hypothetical protein